MVSAKSHKIFPIISELAKRIIWAIYVIYSIAWDQIFIKLSNRVNGSARERGDELTVEDPRGEVAAAEVARHLTHRPARGRLRGASIASAHLRGG